MKAARWFAPRDVRIVEIDKPTPKPHEALIRIESAGVCGSDLHYYEEGHIGTTVIEQPLILGHEYAGVVEEVGENADKSLVGKRVAVEPGIPCLECEWCKTGHYNVCLNMFFPGGPGSDGAFTEYITVHAGFCFPVSDTISAAEAAMIEPLAVAIHTVELARLKPGENAAILGLGPIGLLVAQVAKFSGVSYIYGTDLHDYRVDVSSEHGVDFAFNADKFDTVETILEQTDGRGVDVVFDAARSAETLGLACLIARPAGRCILTGISGNCEDSIPVDRARRKELNLQWCRRFKNNFPTAISLLESGKIDAKSLITHSFPLEETHKALELVSNFEDGVLKASIDM